MKRIQFTCLGCLGRVTGGYDGKKWSQVFCGKCDLAHRIRAERGIVSVEVRKDNGKPLYRCYECKGYGVIIGKGICSKCNMRGAIADGEK